MVVCKYFQQGNCRFGTTCTNEHFDVKQILKSDMETALNSKQWPLSCYGPFKDKACIPNFIEDQSFEEVRQMCYDARQKNYFEQFNQQFTQGVIEANNKMKSMLQPTTQLIELACKIYDTELMESARPSQNVFANASIGGNSNAFGNTIFNANNTNTNSSGNLFANNNNNAFGATNTKPLQQQTPSIFGQQAATHNNNANLQNSGGFSFVNNNTNLTSSNSSSGGNIFGNTPQLSQGGGAAGIFGQTAVQQNAVSGVGLFSQQQQPQQTTAPQNTTSFNNLFSQQAATTMPTAQTTTAVFNQNPFGQQQAQAQQQSGSGIFAQQSNNMFMAQQQQQQPVQQTAPSVLFAQAVPAKNNMAPQQVQGQNLFAKQPALNSIGAGGNIFAQQQQQQPPQLQQGLTNNQQATGPPAGLFQQSAQQTAAPPANAASSVYSRMEDLTPEEIEAFQSPIFLPGKIPCCPPPREFVN